MIGTSILLAVVLAGALVYCILILFSVHSYLRQPRRLSDGTPISVLKPLMGAEEGLEANLRSFFRQEYSSFEVLAAVRSADDPAAAIFSRLQGEYSHVPSRLIVTGEPPYANAKVFSLARMLAAAENDLLVMSDSDIRAEPDMLRSIAAEFEDPRIGLATCPYTAIAGDSFWSSLEAEGMNTEFLGGLLVARMLMGVDFAVGPTIVARRRVLDHVGFDRLKEYLAEDFVMGKVAAEAGMGVILSRTIVEHRIGAQRFLANASHRLRWARSTRRSRPMGYAGQVFTNPLPLALALLCLHPGWWALLIPSVLLRAVAAWMASSVVLNRQVNWVMLPLQDLLGFAFWIAGFFGNTIVWRGQKYYLHPDGRFSNGGTANPAQDTILPHN